MNDEVRLDSRVRYEVYQHFVRTARAPTPSDLAGVLQVAEDVITQSLTRLDANHAIVLRAGSTDILMAHPFSDVPTGYETHIGSMTYWPNCGWDSMGIVAAINQPARISFHCPDCQEVIEFSVVDGELDNHELLVHFAVPARHWWDDIVFT